jgi:hypothetical protein
LIWVITGSLYAHKMRIINEKMYQLLFYLKYSSFYTEHLSTHTKTVRKRKMNINMQYYIILKLQTYDVFGHKHMMFLDRAKKSFEGNLLWRQNDNETVWLIMLPTQTDKYGIIHVFSHMQDGNKYTSIRTWFSFQTSYLSLN